MTEELKACPFCGGECALGQVTGKLRGNEQIHTHIFVNCILCGSSNAGITQGFPTRKQAIVHWNTRADPERDRYRAALEAIRNKIDYYAHDVGLTHKLICKSCVLAVDKIAMKALKGEG